MLIDLCGVDKGVNYRDSSYQENVMSIYVVYIFVFMFDLLKFLIGMGYKFLNMVDYKLFFDWLLIVDNRYVLV